MTETVAAEGLTKRFGERTVVDSLSFSSHEGEVVGLLGPNGAGKTTTIRLLSCILTPSAGTFRVAGVPRDRPDEIRRRIGVLPENAGYPERRTGAEFLRFHGELFGLSRRDAARRAAELLTEVGLEDRAATPIAAYSRGMRQRLGIARALLAEPAVVLLDEPTLGLDPAGQRQVLGLVRTLARDRGATFLLSTHLLAEVDQTCSTVLILDRGRLVASGTVDEVIRSARLPRAGRLRVHEDAVDEARSAVAAVGAVRCGDGERPGELMLSGDDERALGAALGAVLAAGLVVLEFEQDGMRLDDAFLRITEEASRR